MGGVHGRCEWASAVCAVGHVGCYVGGGGYPVGVSISSSYERTQVDVDDHVGLGLPPLVLGALRRRRRRTASLGPASPAATGALVPTCGLRCGRRVGQPTQRAANYTARSHIEPAQTFPHANGLKVLCSY